MSPGATAFPLHWPPVCASSGTVLSPRISAAEEAGCVTS